MPQSAPPLSASLRTPVLTGLAVLVAFLGGVGTWAGLAPLSGAAIAPGVVSPDGNRKTVQHLEGGIIRAIHVEDGHRVRAGEPLITLDDTAAQAAHERLLARHRVLAAMLARLLAEQGGAAGVTVPAELRAAAESEPAVAETLAAELSRFRTRRAALAGRQAVLRQRTAQLEEEIGGLEAHIASLTEQLGLIELELADVAKLVDKGLERRSRLLALERARSQIDGLRAEKKAAVARARQGIGEAELQILSLATTHEAEVAAELGAVRAELAQLDQELQVSRDVVARTVVRAPVAGTVVQLRHRTPEGVVAPGAPLLDLVPEDDELLIDARVAPVDIDAVRAGLPAHVHLLAYSQRTMPRIQGRVRQVSADRLIEPATGAAYFAARIEVDRDQLALLAPAVALAPGMPAEVLILTGERTALDHLIDPFRALLRRSFRES